MLDVLKGVGIDVSRETLEGLQAYLRLLEAESRQQNLIATSSIPEAWTRHIVDSLQLLRFADTDREWLDIGSGAGLPGIVLAISGVKHITLVEPRRLRTDFLQRVADELQLCNVRIVTGKAERLQGSVDVITARAVASLDRLFEIGTPLVRPGGRWVLPKGRTAEEELAQARQRWQGAFKLEPSLTDAEARIVVAEGVRRVERAKRK